MKETQGGEIGLVLGSQSFEPYSSKSEDVAAAKRLMDFFMGWLVQLIKPSAFISYSLLCFPCLVS